MGKQVCRALSFVVLFAICLVFSTGCAPVTSNVPLPTSKWNGVYNFVYNTPEVKSPGSTEITVAVVQPTYVNHEEIIMKNLAQGFSTSFASDLDSIIVAKGMTATGPFDSLELMTYPEKKNAILTLYPEYVFAVLEKNATDWEKKGEYAYRSFDLTFSGTIFLQLRESLSSEKLWIKKIPIKAHTVSCTQYAELITLYDEKKDPLHIFPTGYETGEMLYDGAQDAAAEIIQSNYKEIMTNIWNYLNIQEMKVLTESANEVRKAKRF